MNIDLAICLTGQPRQLYLGYKDFKIFTKNIACDVFIHTWQSENLLSTWGNNMGWENRQTPVFPPEQAISMYLPKKSVVEDYQQTEFFKNTIPQLGYRNPVNHFNSSLSQYYSTKKSIYLKHLYEQENRAKYKYVIRTRFDLNLNEDDKGRGVDLPSHFRRIDENENLVLVNPGWDWPDGRGCSDIFAIGSNRAMMLYSHYFDYYRDIREKFVADDFNEARLRFYLEKVCGLRVEHTTFTWGIYR